jgi:uncharacterized repeat protein (TIGR01451 family)
VIVYNIAVTNTGGASGTTVLSDVVPANTTFTGAAAQGWSCTAPAAAGASCTQTVTVAAGATVTKQYTLTVNTPLPAGTTQVANLVASSTGTCSSCNPSNPTVPVLDTVKTVATVNGVAATTATPVKAGDVIVYNIAVTNTGGSSGTTVLSDVVPANTSYTGAAAEGWSCANPSPAGTTCTQSVTVAAGTTVTKQYTLTVNTPVPAGVSTIANTVTTSTGTCSSCTVTNPTTPTLDTVKTIATVNGVAATTSTQVKAGDVIVYNITVTNGGGASGTTTLTDVVPANTSYTGAAAQGWSCTAPAAAGTSCTQAVTVAAGATVTKQYTLTVNTPIPAGVTTIANVVTTSSGTCSSCTVTNPTVPVLDTVKTVATVNGVAATAATQVKAGDVIVYDIVTTNTGGASGTTTLSDPVPTNTTYTGAAAQGWSCAAPAAAGTACTQAVTVAAGTSVTKQYTLTVNTPLPAGTTQVANLVASSGGTCSSCNPSNPTSPVLDTVKTVATVNGAAATTSTQVKAGDVIVYNIAVTNAGGSSATTTLTDVVPANTTYTGAAAQGWSCAAPAAAGTSCTQGVTVPANSSVTKQYTLTVNTPIPANVTTIANVVTTSSGTCSSCTVTNPTVPSLDTVKTVATVNGTAATATTQVKAGDVIVYNIVTTNTGGSTGTTTLSDPVPANTSYTGAAAEGWSCPAPAAAGTACTQSVTVAAGASVTKTYTLTVTTPIPAGVTQIANLVASSGGTCSSCNPSNPTVPVLDTTKTVATVNGTAATSATSVKAGDVIVYNIVTKNTGGAAGTTTLSDTVPANTTYTGAAGEGWSCANGATAGTACTQVITVPAGGTTTVTYTLTVVTPLPAGTTHVANLVTSSDGTCSSCNPSNPTGPSVNTVKHVATVNGAAATSSTQVKAGDVIVYDIVTTNTGGSSATTTLTDTVPANTTYTGAAAQGWSCASGSVAGTACTQSVTVPAGATVTKQYTLTVVTPLPANTTTVANLVTSSGGTCSDCNPSNPTVPSLDTVKHVATVNGAAATSSTRVKAGDVIVYDIVTTNTGGSTGTTTLADTVPANTTYTGAAAEGWSCANGAAAGAACTQAISVAAGASVTKQYTLTVVTPLPANTTTVANLVTSSGGTCSDCNPANPVGPLLDTVKHVSTVNGVAATASTQVKAGDVIVYTITTTNTGGSTGTSTLSDTVPANTTYSGPVAQGWSCASGSVAGTACTQDISVAAGTSVSKQYTLTVVTPLPANTTTVANLVAATNSTCSDCNPSNPTVPVLDTVKTVATVNGAAATAATQVKAGDVVVYNIVTTNTGGSTGTTTLADTVPVNTSYTGAAAEGWSCPNPSVAGTACTQDVTVAAGASVTKQYTITVVTPLPAGTTQVANLVTSSGGTCSDCNPTNPTVPGLDTTKTVATVNGAAATSSTQVKPGDVIVYNIVTKNSGGSSGTTTLSDTVPVNTTYTGAAAEGWSCASGSAAGTACTQDVTVAAGASVTKTFTMTVNATLPANTTTVANLVTSTGGTCSDCNPSNPTAPVLDTVKTVATVNGLGADATTQVKPGDVIVYNIVTTNTGGSTGTTVLSDVVPANTTYTGAAAEGWSCPSGSAAGTACTQTVSVASGAAVTKTFTMTVNATLPPNTTTVANLVTSTGGTCSDCNPSNPTAPVLDTVKHIATVNGAAATSSTQVKPGDVIVYNIVTTNTGGSSGTTTLADTVPANTTYTGAVAEGWSCASGSAAGTACTQDVTVAAGGTSTVTYTMTVNATLPANTTTVANLVASSGGTCSDCNPSNPTAPVLDTFKVILSVNGLTATSSTQVKAGDVVVYGITVRNTGGSSGTTTLTDAVPANTTYTGVAAEGWSCASGSAAGTACTQDVTVAAGASVTKQYTVTLVTPLPDNTTEVTNLVTSSTGTCSSCTVTNPTAPVLDTVKTIVSVNGTAATPATEVKGGDVIVYAIAVTNTGGSTGSTTLTDAVPANSTYTGAAAEGWSCPAGSTAGTSCTQAVTVAAGATETVHYTVTLDAPLPDNTTHVTNLVTSSTGTCSSCSVTNPTAAVLNTIKSIATVNGSPATTATSLSSGDVVVYRLTVTNTGGPAPRRLLPTWFQPTAPTRVPRPRAGRARPVRRRVRPAPRTSPSARHRARRSPTR